jgi:aspartyl-tRNA(Asn)/glutamyl-tRNA(Gln) amidotransferase subunit B
MYKTTIGLEIHFESKTKSKMFCACANEENIAIEEKPNTNVCPICMGHPGTLPTINEEAINKIIMTGLALNCEIADKSKFDRKSYFYPDLPKGYQISQYDMPFCKNGHLVITLNNGEKKRIGITRIHMEEDTARLAHENGGGSLVDFNRSGVPLMELVTEPDINSAEEAKKFCQDLQLILKYLGVSNADMEKGQMRCEVNISLNKDGDSELGTKVEVKNLNSFKAVEKSIEYEIKRQSGLLDKGEKVTQETRGWHDDKQITMSQRSKENAHEYRYFPEPDLPTITINQAKIDEIKGRMPELPEQKAERFSSEYGLEKKEIEFFIRDFPFSKYFEKTISDLLCWKEDTSREDVTDKNWKDLVKLCSNYMITDLQALVKSEELGRVEYTPEYLESRISPENFAELMCLISSGEISSKIAKIVLAEMFANGKDPSQIIVDQGLTQVGDYNEVEKIVDAVLAKNAKAVEDYKSGKQNSFAFLIGQIMAASRGTVNPQKAAEILKLKIG